MCFQKMYSSIGSWLFKDKLRGQTYCTFLNFWTSRWKSCKITPVQRCKFLNSQDRPKCLMYRCCIGCNKQENVMKSSPDLFKTNLKPKLTVKSGTDWSKWSYFHRWNYLIISLCIWTRISLHFSVALVMSFQKMCNVIGCDYKKKKIGGQTYCIISELLNTSWKILQNYILKRCRFLNTLDSLKWLL